MTIATRTIADWAVELGVTEDALTRLGCMVDDAGNLRWPERDGDGAIIGSTTRYPDGSKKADAGGKRGLCYAAPLDAYAGTSPLSPLLSPEGLSDTATAIDLGYDAIGRPSATGGNALLVALLDETRHGCIVGENDGGAGRTGAEKCAAELHGRVASIKVIYPPECYKDLRAWVRTEGIETVRARLATLIDDAPLWEPKREAAESVLTWRPFPTQRLPRSLWRYVKELAGCNFVDDTFVVMPLLSMLGSAIGTTRLVRVNRAWHEFPIVWAMTVAETGTTKTPTMRATHKPLHEAQNRAMEVYRQEVELHRAAAIAFDCRMKAYRGKPVGDPPAEPEQPKPRRYIVSDITIEALAPVLDANPRGVLAAADELSGLIAGLDAYKKSKGSDITRYLQAWSGEFWQIDRKGAAGPCYIPRAAVSICGGIQPGILTRAVSESMRLSGFASRFLIAFPPKRPRRFSDRDLSIEAENGLRRIVGGLLALEHGVDDGGDPVPIEICLSPKARERFIQWHNVHADITNEAAGDVRGALAKMYGYVLRLALIFHLAGQASGEDVGEAIDLPTIEDAIEAVNWFAREAERVYGLFDESDGDREKRELVEWIQGRGGSATARELSQGPRRFRGKTEAAEKALSDLAASGVGEWVMVPAGPKGGQTTRRFQVHTAGYGTTTYEIPEVFGGSVAVATDEIPKSNGWLDVDESAGGIVEGVI